MNIVVFILSLILILILLVILSVFISDTNIIIGRSFIFVLITIILSVILFSIFNKKTSETYEIIDISLINNTTYSVEYLDNEKIKTIKLDKVVINKDNKNELIKNKYQFLFLYDSDYILNIAYKE